MTSEGDSSSAPWFETIKEESVSSLVGENKYQLMQHLRDGDLSAEEASGILRVNVSVARKHLETLENDGFAISRFERASLGRPKKLYSITDSGRELFPRKYDSLADSLLTKLSASDPKLLAQATSELAHEIANKIKLAIDVQSKVTDNQRLNGLVDVLNSIGFRAKLRPHKGDKKVTDIIRTDCAVFHVAKSHPEIVCEIFDTELLSSVMGEDVKLIQTMACGARQCVHTVSHHPNGK